MKERSVLEILVYLLVVKCSYVFLNTCRHLSTFNFHLPLTNCKCKRKLSNYITRLYVLKLTIQYLLAMTFFL